MLSVFSSMWSSVVVGLDYAQFSLTTTVFTRATGKLIRLAISNEESVELLAFFSQLKQIQV